MAVAVVVVVVAGNMGLEFGVVSTMEQVVGFAGHDGVVVVLPPQKWVIENVHLHVGVFQNEGWFHGAKTW